MKKRIACYAVSVLLAALLYFFENNTGSRIVLCCALLLPLSPDIRHALTAPDESTGRRRAPRAAEAPVAQDEEEPSDIRAYLPGDPVNRIHWKLSAKRSTLLVREPAAGPAPARAEAEAAADQPSPARPRRTVMRTGFLLALLSALLLWLLPAARLGAEALLNRVFDASEAVNAYVYRRFPVPAGTPVLPAAALLSIIALVLSGMVLLSGSRLPGLLAAAGCVLFQIYFGLAFPAWINVALFAGLTLLMLKRPCPEKTAISALSAIAAVSLALLLLWPGVDAATEAASESVRDSLSRIVQAAAGASAELPAGETETRHVHNRSLLEGTGEARTERAYRLFTEEQAQISGPRWVDVLRIVLLLLLTAALTVLPFLPFAVLIRRRKQALEARETFRSANVSEAIVAIFQYLTAWLEAAGKGSGNLPYAQWSADLAPGYAERFAQCERLFEEAAYSTHDMREPQRQQLLALLEETERILRLKAGWRQRLRLRYREWLWR